jgi:hypothetical protein
MQDSMAGYGYISKQEMLDCCVLCDTPEQVLDHLSRSVVP